MNNNYYRIYLPNGEDHVFKTVEELNDFSKSFFEEYCNHFGISIPQILSEVKIESIIQLNPYDVIK